MSNLVRSSQFGVRSKADIVWSAVIRGTWRPQRGRNGGRSKDDLAGTLKFIRILFVFIICSFSITVTCASEPPLRTVSSSPSPFDEIKKTYAEVKTLETQFSQKIFISSLKKERDSKGEFFFKRQKGFLWRYKAPKVQYFLYDGKFIWQEEDDKPFIMKDKIDKEKTGGTFFDLIEDIAKIDELFTIKEQKIIGDLEVLELLPKKEGTVNSAKVWIDKQKRVKKLEIYEFTGNINTIEFSATKVNQPIDDGKFVFKRDGSKEIVER